MVCTYLEIQMAEYDPERDEGGGELHEKRGGQQAVPFPAPAHHVITEAGVLVRKL
jgi:hypothetical protein